MALLRRSNPDPTAPDPFEVYRQEWDTLDFWRELRVGDVGKLRGRARRYRMASDARQPYVASPLPAVISTTKTTLLLNEPISFTAGNEADTEQLGEWVASNSLQTKTREASDTISHQGGVLIKAGIDATTPEGRKRSRISFVGPRRSVRRFSADGTELTGADIITDMGGNSSGDRWRLVESHDSVEHPGVVRTRLYKGNDSALGVPVSLESLPATADLAPEVVYDPTGAIGSLVFWVPNKPTTGGQLLSDYAGIEHLILAHSQLLTQTQMAVRSAVPFYAVRSEYLDDRGNLAMSDGPTVLPINDAAGMLGEGGKPIEIIQGQLPPDLLAHCDAMAETVLEAAGINPASLGRNIEGGSVSGTALRLRQATTLAQIAYTASVFSVELGRAMRAAQMLDAMSFEGKTAQPWTAPDDAPAVNIRHGLPVDLGEIAEQIEKLRRGEAISTQRAVELATPNWDEAQRTAEVERIEDERDGADLGLGGLLNQPPVGE